MLPLLTDLDALTTAHPHQRKLLIGPSMAWGRELLASLAVHRGGWIGWRATTLDALAGELTYTAQAVRARRRVGSLEQQMLLDDAVTSAAAQQPLPDDLTQALRRNGARRAVHQAVIELCEAGAGAAARDGWPLGALLDRIRADYETALRDRALIDRADVLSWATDDSVADWEWFADTVVVIADLDAVHGLSAVLRDRLVTRGAHVLHDAPQPLTHLSAFTAATPADEIREILRRAIDGGLTFDDIEIAATDDDSYAIAVDTVCTTLGIEASMTRGVPITATRVGRQVLEWLDDLPAALDDRSPRGVAGELLLQLDAMELDEGSIDDRNRTRCADELRSVIAALDQPMPHGLAQVVVRETIRGLRGWAMSSGVERPRFSGGVSRGNAIVGRVHVTTLANAGLSGRRLCAVVGLDAERTRGPMIQSAVLPDAMREAISPELLTTARRRRMRGKLVTQAIARAAAASERVLLSFATATATTGREAGPSQALLDAVRQTDPEVRDHDLLRTRLGQPIGAIPSPDQVALDARDVWLKVMERDGLLLDGAELVASTVDGLRAGLARAAAAEDVSAVEAHGVVADAKDRFDPRVTGEPISPSSLETLGSCGLQWFYRHVLHVSSSPGEQDDEAWLDAAARGDVLHEAYAKVLRRRLLVDRERQRNDVEEQALHIADGILAQRREKYQPFSEEAFQVARNDIQSEVRTFVRLEWAEPPLPVPATEEWFGAHGHTVDYLLPDGSSVRLKGTIDRADTLPDTTLRIIDYKTGRPFVSDTPGVPLEGGRRLQLPLYADAATQVLQREVSQAELRYPTVRGGGEVEVMDPRDREAAPQVVQAMLDAVAAGEFVPTDDVRDCRWCDYQAICRVSVGDFGATSSPRAEWAAKTVAATGSVPRALLAQRARRTKPE
jgi:CRISPR/Cas system-associated exonuclease Cas4 (RecB family)